MKESISLRSAFNYIWQSPNKWSAILTWVGLGVALGGVLFLLQILTLIPILGIVLSCIILPLFIIGEFLAIFYVLGFIYEVTELARAGKSDLPKVLDNYKPRLEKGALISLSNFVYNLPSAILYMVVLFGSFFVGALISESEEVIVILSFVLIALVSLLYIVVAILNSFLSDAATYRYLSTGSFSAAFEFGKVFQIIKKGFKERLQMFWRELLIGIGMSILFLLVYSPFIVILAFEDQTGTPEFGLVMVVLMCLMFVLLFAACILTIPFGFYVLPHLKGQVFKLWDKKGLKKI